MKGKDNKEREGKGREGKGREGKGREGEDQGATAPKLGTLSTPLSHVHFHQTLLDI
jgi:hypothetical protein